MTGYTDSALRILFIAPFAPSLNGRHGGSRTVARLMLGLAERHRVALIHFQLPGELPVDDRLAGRCEFIESVPLEFRDTIVERSRRQLRVAFGLLVGKPRWATNWTNGRFNRRTQAAVRDWRPDIVQAEFHVMGQYLQVIRARGLSRVLVQHEPGVRVALDRFNASAGIGRILASVEMQAWRRYETAIMRSADAVVAFTKQDRDALHGLTPDSQIEIIPVGVDLPPVAMRSTGIGPPRLLFVGNFVHPPNVDAALRLLDDIFPEVRKTVPTCRLDIVGHGPPDVVRCRASENVVVTGGVPDVGPYMKEATVVLAPLRVGGGIRIKVLEALAAGKAVIASPRAVEGLSVVDGEQLRIASGDAEFAAAIVELLQAPAQRAALERRAREWAAEHLDPSVVARCYEQLYSTLRR